MRKIFIPALAIAAAATAVLATQATRAVASDDDCRAYPREEWQSEDAIKARFLELGYRDPRGVSMDDGCFEVKGYDQAGNRVEVTFDPKTAELVKMERDD